MRELLISNGFEYIGTCNCYGKPKKYKKGNCMIKIYEGKKRWELYRDGRAVIQGKEDQLSEAIKQYA